MVANTETSTIKTKENKNTMSKDKDETQEQATAAAAGAESVTAIATRESAAVAQSGNNKIFDAIAAYGRNLSADAALQASMIDDLLKKIAVTEFKGAKAFLGQRLSLLDAFSFEMTEEVQGEKVPVPKVMYEVADEFGEVHHVMQNLNPSRQRFIDLFAQIKSTNAAAGTDRKLTLTPVEFMEVGAARFGNRAIVLSMIQGETNTVWS